MIGFIIPPRYKYKGRSFIVQRFRTGVDLSTNTCPPYDVALFSGYVKSRGCEVRIFDADVLNSSIKQVFDWIDKNDCEIFIVKCGDTTLLEDLKIMESAVTIV